MKRTMLKVGVSLVAMVVAIAVAVPAQALITNVDIANNAGISYSKLKLSKKIVSKDIKDGTIKSADLHDDAVETDNIEDDAVTSDKIENATITGDDLANDISLNGNLVVEGGDVLVTPKSAAGTATEGNIYYDSDDDNLYVRTTAGWTDLTAGAAGSNTLDDAYNTSAGASTVIVDAGDLTLQSNAGATGDIIVDLNSTGDFLIQDAGVTYATFSDTGVVTLATGTAFNVNGDTIDADGALDITGATGMNINTTAGGLTVDATAGSVIIDGGEAVDSAVTIRATGAAGGIDITSLGDVDISTTGAATEDISLLNTGGSINVTATEVDADAIVLNATLGGLNVDSALAMDIDTAAGNIVIDSVDAGAGAIVPEDDSEDDLGLTGTRWATIFADTLNYSTALTDGGAAGVTTVALGTTEADGVTITANTAITDTQWSVTAAGVATFASINGPIGVAAPGAIDATTIQLDDTLTFDTNNDSINNVADDIFDFTREDAGTVTITASDDNAVAALVVTPGSTGALTLGTNAATTDITLATDGTGTAEVVLPTGSIDSTEILDTTIAGGDLAANIAITTSGTLTSTGTVNFGGATTTLEVPNGADLPATCSIGMVFHDTNDDACADGNAGDGALCICKSADTWALVGNF